MLFPASNPIATALIPCDAAPADVPIAIGLVYTTPEATICQSDALVTLPYAEEVIVKVVPTNDVMMPAMNMVVSAVENMRTV